MQKTILVSLSRLAVLAGVLCLLGTGIAAAGHVHAGDAGVRHECGPCAAGLVQPALGVTRTPASSVPQAAASLADRTHPIIRSVRHAVAPSRAPPSLA